MPRTNNESMLPQENINAEKITVVVVNDIITERDDINEKDFFVDVRRSLLPNE